MAFTLRPLAPEARAEAVVVSKLLWVILGLYAVITAVSVGSAKLRFAHPSPLLPAIAGAILLLLAVRGYSAYRGIGDARLRLGIDVVIFFALTALGDLTICYAAATVPAPDATAFIQRLDHAIGFSWFDYAQRLSGLTPVVETLAFVYRAWLPVMLVAIAALIAIKDFEAIGEYAISSTLTFMAIAAVFACVDVRSLESVASYSLPGFHHPSGAGPHYLQILQRLRSEPLPTLDFERVAGLISFPSLHCASALLMVGATGRLGRWRYPFFVFNVLVVISTLSEGGHNAFDVIAGALIAFAALAVSPALYRAFARRAEARATAPVGALAAGLR